MFHRIIPVTLCLILAVMPGLSARADQAGDIGTILSVEGTATVTPAGQPPAAAALNGKIRLNDVIETGPASRVYILFADDTQITLSEKTRLKVDAYVYNPDDATGNKAHYSFAEGAFQYISGFIAKKADPDVGIETPVGSIGIRGTDIWAGGLDGAYGLYVNEGRVNLANAAGQVQVDAGLGTSAKSRSDAPAAAQKWGAEQIRRIRASVFLKERELIEQRKEKIRAEREKLREEKRARVKAEVQQLLAQKRQANKQLMAQAWESGRQQVKQQLRAQAKQIAQQKHQEIMAMRQQARQLKQQKDQATDRATKQALAQQLRALWPQIKAKRAGKKDAIHAEMQPIAQQAHEQLRASMQQKVEQLHEQTRQEMEQKIKGLRQDAQQEMRAQMQQMLQESKAELQAQLQQVRAEGEQQIQQVMQEEQQQEDKEPDEQ